MSLKENIEAFAAAAAKVTPPELIVEIQKSIDDVKATGIAKRALNIDDLAPDFVLPNALGHPVALKDFLKRGPLIVSFYRGVWCPYCNLELRAYQNVLPEIRAAGGDLVAISPQTPDSSLSTIEKGALTFEVLSDIGNIVAEKFGIAYPIPEAVKRTTAHFGTSIAAANGSDDDQLPISATYVIDRSGRIVLTEIDPDFRRRLEPAEALAKLKAMGKSAQNLAAE